MKKWLLLAAALALPGGTAAGPLITGLDTAEIRSVISRQIEAFRRDDARGAFALASPAVQHSFGSAEKFLDAVRASYAAMVRPAALAFLPMQVMGEDVVQPLQVTDRAGRVWVAYYAMQRQADGSWRTSGCYLAPPVRTIRA